MSINEDEGRDAASDARKHIEAAERDLVEARKAEDRAEKELRQAAEELVEAGSSETEIVINGQLRTVPGHEVGFDQIIKLAFPQATPEQNVSFAVTYHRAASAPHAGELALGGRVHVKKGTRFNVTRTVQS